MKILLIDNYDSFTYNLVQYLQELGATVTTVRNDAISLKEIEQAAPQKIIISPGPCTPTEAGISLELIQHFANRIPILGVCLGHQSIGQIFGGKVIRAETIMHGKISMIYHKNTDIFQTIPNPFRATRYHSLIVEKNSLPDCLEVTAWTQHEDGSIDDIMGLKHREYPIFGVQFHPESIMTEHGHTLLKNFLEMTNKI